MRWSANEALPFGRDTLDIINGKMRVRSWSPSQSISEPRTAKLLQNCRLNTASIKHTTCHRHSGRTKNSHQRKCKIRFQKTSHFDFRDHNHGAQFAFRNQTISIGQTYKSMSNLKQVRIEGELTFHHFTGEIPTGYIRKAGRRCLHVATMTFEDAHISRSNRYSVHLNKTHMHSEYRIRPGCFLRWPVTLSVVWRSRERKGEREREITQSFSY